MLAPRLLQMVAQFLQMVGGTFLRALALVALRAQTGLGFEQPAMFGGERGDLRFAREKRAVLFVHPAAIDNPGRGDELASAGGESQLRRLFFQRAGLLEVLDENDST